ncbi:MAG: hypothetical protein GTN64_05305, partial [Candidatus Latescibacteria bacterium]|nr:hypothetical protein [Candidatus Latescibacterota bacterium]NIO78027.1 hypothetical protein [Candidatus Latescibacterota bacterium]
MLVTADLPGLNAALDVRFRGSAEEQRVDLKIREVNKRALLPPFTRTTAGDSPAGVVNARFKMKTQKTRSITIDGSGESKGFKILDQEINGNFSSRFDLDPGLQEAQIAADFQLSHISSAIFSKLSGKKIPFVQGSVTARFQGRYHIPDKSLDVKALTIDTPVGAADGQGIVNLNAEPINGSAGFRFRHVPLNLAKPFFPQPLHDFEYRGIAGG